MYNIVKSEMISFHHVTSKPVIPYRQVQVNQFQKFKAALIACEIYNHKSCSRYYITNESGKEYYEGTWID